jgi:tRNA pseudouridine55 synthase
VTAGVLVIDKPVGPTSHDVVDRVRRALGTRRVGHTGTLDPFASGVLPVCVGKATRLVRFLSGGEKEYAATLRLGFATTTDDLQGEPLGDARVASVEPAALEQAARGFLGDILQVPPTFSAKRSGGRRHHELARAGTPAERTACAVHIAAIEITRVSGDLVEMNVRCSPGTYIRALARDIGERLGVGGHLHALRRTRSGAFGLADAATLDDLQRDGAAARMVPLAQLLPELPAVQVGAPGLTALRHGRDLQREAVLSGFPEAPLGPMRVLDEAGALVAVAVPRGFDAAAPGLSFEPCLHPDLVLID